MTVRSCRLWWHIVGLVVLGLCQMVLAPAVMAENEGALRADCLVVAANVGFERVSESVVANDGVLFRGSNDSHIGLRLTPEQVAPGSIGDDILGGLRQCFRSFSGETEVLMADGTTKPISAVEVGDWVLAEDPETGERGAREVTQLWVHQDAIFDLEIDGHDVATTEDHPFWNHTDREWQRADVLDPGDLVLAADGAALAVGDFDLGSARTTTAYNLSVDGIHTYFVAAGHAQVLVHNTGCDEAAEIIMREIGGDIRTFRPPEGVPSLGQYRLADEAWTHHTVVVANGRVYDQFTGSAGVPIDNWKALWTYADAIDFGF